ncbi:hypothetical protein I4U23_031382 [Adineta vaga]|nr:hypothetical protein I4U23_031382 [Adineta vaga]
MSSLKEYLLKLNLFSPSDNSNEQETDQQHHWNIIEQFKYLPINAKCSYSRISIPYVCLSDFISDRWIKDFRRMSSAQFQSHCYTFCRLSKTNINQKVFSENDFRSYINSVIVQFKITAPNSFKSKVQIIDKILINTILISGIQTGNYYVKVGKSIMTHETLTLILRLIIPVVIQLILRIKNRIPTQQILCK